MQRFYFTFPLSTLRSLATSAAAATVSHVNFPARVPAVFVFFSAPRVPSCIWRLMVIGKKKTLFAHISHSFVKTDGGGGGKIKNEFQKQSRMKLEWQQQQPHTAQPDSQSRRRAKIVQHETNFLFFPQISLFFCLLKCGKKDTGVLVVAVDFSSLMSL